MSEKFTLFTDSTSDLPQEMVDNLNINMINLTYHIGERSFVNYVDYREQTINEFYDEVRAGALPTTSQVNPEDYLSIITPHLEKGEDVLILSFSSKLSGTYNSGRIAVEELKEKFPNNKIEIIDTKSASLGEGFLVRLAALEKNKGKSIEEVKEFVENTIPKVAHWFTVDDISHLRRGGRVSAFSSVVARALNIKPIMHCDENGALVPRKKAIGRRKAIRELFDKMKQAAVENQEYVMIGHGDDLDSANQLAELIKAEYPNVEILIHTIGAVIGAHTGQGVLALFFLANER
ncbi:MAG TPA: DegV family protein [Acholeplasmataceae bacterium]|nr:DegV family protein [Acholeplasmataceae bacterium]